MAKVTVVQPAASAGFTRGDIKRFMAQDYGYDPDDNQFGNIVADRTNLIIDEMSTMFRWQFSLQFGKDNVGLVKDQQQYNLAELFSAFDQPAFMFHQSTPYLLRYMPFRELYEKFPEEETGGESYYYTLEGAEKMRLWPIPGSDGVVTFAYYAQLPHLENDSQRMFWKAKYDQVLIKGVKREMAEWRNKNQSDILRKADVFDKAVRWMRLDDAVVVDWKMRFRDRQENRSRYGLHRDNSRDLGSGGGY